MKTGARMSDRDGEQLNNLLISVAEGHGECLDGIYKLAAKQMFAVAYGIVRDKMTAEDVVHDSFIKIAKYAKKYRRNTNAAGWIMRITRNTALDHLRRKRSERAVSADELYYLSSTDYSPELRENAIVLESAIARLGEDEKKVIYCRYYLDMTVREIAKELKLSKSAAERALQRAEQKLKNFLKSGTDGGTETL